jgi:uncharacterized protein (TIGR02246 family)
MDQAVISNLYKGLLSCWNRQDAKGMASLFAKNGNVIGFDGSQNDGKNEIEFEMQKIFSNHQTASFVWIVREIRFLTDDVALLRAVVGMIPPGKNKIMQDRNAIQSLIVAKENEGWKIALFQNTPAQFHGRPELSEALTKELNELVD